MRSIVRMRLRRIRNPLTRGYRTSTLTPTNEEDQMGKLPILRAETGGSRQFGARLIAAVCAVALLSSMAAPVVDAQQAGSASTLGGGLKEAQDVKVIYVGCNSPTSFFWARVTRGAQEAANN